MKITPVVLLGCSCAFATNYYVSSLHGKSSNNGLSVQTPWPGLAWVHEYQLLPGDSVLIEAGSDLSGPFFIVSAGTADDDYGAVGVEIEGSNNRVYNNSFVGLRALSFDYGYDGGAVEFYGEADSNEIFANRADHCNGFMEIGGGSAKGNRVHHNLMVDDFLSTAWFHLEGTFASQVEDFRIEHNTIVFRNPEPWSYILGFKGVASENAVLFRNNLVLSAAPFTNSDFMTRTSNIYVPIGIVWDAPGETETTNALLADTAAGDWRPLPGSVAIGAAMVLPYVNDAAGLAYGASRDVGAYQHVGYTALRNPRPQPKPEAASVRWWNLLGRTSSAWHP